jgi:ABC-2 type transport system ATP-binding protein
LRAIAYDRPRPMSKAIRFENVSKRYVLGHEAMLLSRLRPRRRQGLTEVWALRDVSFEVERGETVAIIGANGSGKTTTLRLLAGVSAPTSGHLRVEGSVAPLIGIGVGFNPELTGRENVFVNARLLGLSAEEVNRSFDSIVAFSELETYLDTPVKFYSSGMFLRLGFSVAVHTSPELLVLDEILAVGDAAFQAKCNERIREMRERGTTVVLVTHNLNLAVKMAKRAMVLSRGSLVFDGDSVEAVGEYHKILSAIRDLSEEDMRPSDDGQIALGRTDVDLDLRDQSGASTRSLASGEPFSVVVTIEFAREVKDPCIGLAIRPADGNDLAMSVFTLPGDYRGEHGPGRPLVATIQMDNRLLTRSYTVHAEIFDFDRTLLGRSTFESFYVKATSKAFGTTDLGAQITINGSVMNSEIVDH